jgi:hypothetical protein
MDLNCPWIAWEEFGWTTLRFSKTIDWSSIWSLPNSSWIHCSRKINSMMQKAARQVKKKTIQIFDWICPSKCLKNSIGIQAIFPQCTKALAVVVAEKAIDEFLPSLPESSTPWVMKVNGSVAFRFTGNENLSVEVSAKAPVITQGEGASPFCFACQSIHIRSTVGSGFSISVPNIRTVDGTLVLQNSIDATVE